MITRWDPRGRSADRMKMYVSRTTSDEALIGICVLPCGTCGIVNRHGVTYTISLPVTDTIFAPHTDTRVCCRGDSEETQAALGGADSSWAARPYRTVQYKNRTTPDGHGATWFVQLSWLTPCQVVWEPSFCRPRVLGLLFVGPHRRGEQVGMILPIFGRSELQQSRVSAPRQQRAPQ